MAPTKFREKGAIKGGTAFDLTLIDSANSYVDLLVDEPPSYFRALAAAAVILLPTAKGIKKDFEYEADTIGLDSLTDDLTVTVTTRAPVDDTKRIVQLATTGDGTFRRKSTSEAAWSAWVPQFDSEQQPLVADIADAGTAALANTGTSGEALPYLSDPNTWGAPQYINAPAGALEITATEQVPLTSGILEKAAPAANEYIYYIYAKHLGHPLSSIALQGLDFTTASEDTRWVFSPVVNGAGVVCFYAGSGIYTAGCTDNGTDSITSKTHYLKAATAPSSPGVAGSAVIYVDSNDGNKVKIKHSNGTITTLSTP